MQYLGSKRRIAKPILEIMLKNRKPGQWFMDLFCGGCNLIENVPAPRAANDLNEYLIALWVALQKGYTPPSEVSEIDYQDAKKYDFFFEKHERGFIGFCCSFGAKWFAGYGRRNVKRDGGNKSLCRENKDTLLRQIKNLMDITFTTLSYDEVVIPANSIIYLDPPYKGTTQYKNKKFDHEKLYDYARNKSSEGHTVFISEYWMPNDFVCVWKTSINTNMGATKNVKSTEKLYVHESQLTYDLL